MSSQEMLMLKVRSSALEKDFIEEIGRRFHGGVVNGRASSRALSHLQHLILDRKEGQPEGQKRQNLLLVIFAFVFLKRSPPQGLPPTFYWPHLIQLRMAILCGHP